MNKAYEDYLVSDEWKALRDKAIELAGNKCRLCNSDYNLHVHHRTYERIYHEDIEDLTVLCGDCHNYYHIMKKEQGRKLRRVVDFNHFIPKVDETKKAKTREEIKSHLENLLPHMYPGITKEELEKKVERRIRRIIRKKETVPKKKEKREKKKRIVKEEKKKSNYIPVEEGLFERWMET